MKHFDPFDFGSFKSSRPQMLNGQSPMPNPQRPQPRRPDPFGETPFRQAAPPGFLHDRKENQLDWELGMNGTTSAAPSVTHALFGRQQSQPPQQQQPPPPPPFGRQSSLDPFAPHVATNGLENGVASRNNGFGGVNRGLGGRKLMRSA